MDSFDLYFLVREEQQEWLDKETEALEIEIEELNSNLQTSGQYLTLGALF